MKQIIDQGAHFGAAAIILVPLATAPSLLTFTLAGAALGLIREITEPGSIVSKGSLLDIAFWALGGAAAGMLAP